MSLRKSINEKCRECIYDPIGGGGSWRQQVTDCSAKHCPLYEVRPVSVSEKENRKAGVISYEVTAEQMNADRVNVGDLE